MTRIFLVVGLLAGCASTATPARSPANAEAPSDAFSDAELAKLDDELREHLEAGGADRIPVHVHFRTRPARDELLDLHLVAYGDRFIGQVPKVILKKIVAREDVVHVSMLTDTGYRG